MRGRLLQGPVGFALTLRAAVSSAPTVAMGPVGAGNVASREPNPDFALSRMSLRVIVTPSLQGNGPCLHSTGAP